MRVDLNATGPVEETDQKVVKELGTHCNGRNVVGLDGQEANDLDQDLVSLAEKAQHQI